MRWTGSVAALVLLVMATGIAAEEALPGPCAGGVVIVRTSMDACSGTVVSEDGLILTGARLAVTPLALSVVGGGAGEAPFLCEKVEVVGIHERHGLALLRACSEGVEWHPLVRAPAGAAPASGGWRMLVRKLDDELAPRETELVTGAIVRTVQEDGSDVIELSGLALLMEAGGALCDEEGRLLGVHEVTVAGEKPRRVVPAGDLEPSAFVPLSRRERDRAGAAALAREAGEGLDRALAPEAATSQMAGAGTAFLTALRALVLDHESAPALVQSGRACLVLGDPAAAATFLERAVEIEATPTAHRLLGDIAVVDRDAERALTHYRAALGAPAPQDAGERRAAAGSALQLGRVVLEVDAMAAAYLASWSAALDPEPAAEAVRVSREELRVKAVASLDGDELTRLDSSCKRGFTLEALDEMLGLPAGASGGADADASGSPPAAGGAIAGIAGMAEPPIAALSEKARASAAPAVAVPESGLLVELPGHALWILPTLGGTRAAVGITDPPQIVEVDLGSGALRQLASLDRPRVLAASGGGFLAIVAVDSGELRVVDLLGSKKERTRRTRLPRGATPRTLAMGAVREDAAFVSWSFPPEARLPAGIGILDLDDGKVRQLDPPADSDGRASLEGEIARASLDLTRVLILERAGSSGAWLELEGKPGRQRLVKIVAIPASPHAAFASDGLTAVDYPGAMFTPELRRHTGSFFYPFLDAPLVLRRGSIDAKGVEICRLSDLEVVGSLPVEVRNAHFPLVASAFLARAAWVEGNRAVRIVALGR